ncbi:MAG: hypothetical protein HXS44_09490 [Theionarchaea archaeon]|nr:hypothetical protein [Theionarchaea archaeon]
MEKWMKEKKNKDLVQQLKELIYIFINYWFYGFVFGMNGFDFGIARLLIFSPHKYGNPARIEPRITGRTPKPLYE